MGSPMRQELRRLKQLADLGFTDVTRDDCNRLFSGFAPEAGAANFLAEYGKELLGLGRRGAVSRLTQSVLRRLRRDARRQLRELLAPRLRRAARA